MKWFWKNLTFILLVTELLRQEREKQKEQQKETAAVKTAKQSARTENGLRNSEQQLLTMFMYKSLSKLLGVNSETGDSGLSREFTAEDESERDRELDQDEKSTEVRKKGTHWIRASDQVGRTARDKHTDMDGAEMNTKEDGGENKAHSKSSSSTYRSMIKLRKDEELDEDQENTEAASVAMARLFSRLLNDVEADTDPERTLPSHAIPKSISDKFRTGHIRGRMSGFQGKGDQGKRDQAVEEDLKTQQRLLKSSARDRTDISSKGTIHQTAVDSGLKEPLLSRKQDYQGSRTQGEDGDTQRKKFLRLLSRKRGLDDHNNYQHSEGKFYKIHL